MKNSLRIRLLSFNRKNVIKGTMTSIAITETRLDKRTDMESNEFIIWFDMKSSTFLIIHLMEKTEGKSISLFQF